MAFGMSAGTAMAVGAVGGGLLGLGGKGGSAPPPPDYAAAARETAQGNLEAARAAAAANRVNQINPYGTLTYTRDPNAATPDDGWTQTINLSPVGQQLLDYQNKTSLGLAGLQDQATGRVAQQQMRGWNDEALQAMDGPMDLNRLPGMGRTLDQYNLPGMGEAYDPNQDTQRAQDLLNARLLPQQERDRAALETRLANQGIMQGSEAWKTAMDDLGRNQNDARQQAALSAINLGMSQQGQRFGQMNTNRGISTAEQQQAFAQRNQNRGLTASELQQRFAQALQGRQQGLQEQNYFNTRDLNNLNALRTGSQVTNPTFSSVPQQATTAGADILGATNALYGNQLNAWNASQANATNQLNGFMGLAGTLGAAAMKTSDRRLKSDIRRIGTHPLGIGVYEYTKFGEREIGVMADEVEQVKPEAVMVHPSGFKMVDYSQL